MSVAYPWLEPPWPSKKMPREQLEDTLQKLLAQKNICVLATIGENGRPIASPIEYYADGLDLSMPWSQPGACGSIISAWAKYCRPRALCQPK